MNELTDSQLTKKKENIEIFAEENKSSNIFASEINQSISGEWLRPGDQLVDRLKETEVTDDKLKENYLQLITRWLGENNVT